MDCRGLSLPSGDGHEHLQAIATQKLYETSRLGLPRNAEMQR